ncbi:MAG: hemerythrin domain-containing protein [bacterium]
MPPLKRDPSLIALSRDHHQGLLRVFFLRQALRAGSGLDHQANVTRAFFESELVPHFRAEEDVLFPLLRPLLDAGDDLIDRLVAEHRELEALSRALDGTAEALARYAELLERHIRTEERVLFELYQARVPATERAAVGQALARATERGDERTESCARPGG